VLVATMAHFELTIDSCPFNRRLLSLVHCHTHTCNQLLWT